jgi:tetratricopeptide (TPR) repeat protein
MHSYEVVADTSMPKAFWELSPKYNQALEQNDYQGIINYGNSIIALFEGRDDITALDNIAPRLERVAQAYEALGYHDEAIDTYKKYIPYAKIQGWDDGITYAESKIAALGFDLSLYIATKDVENNTYFNAKHETPAGMYFGSTYDKDPNVNGYEWADIQRVYPKKNSTYLIYVQWGQQAADFDRYFQAAKSNKTAVQLAWNIDTAPEGEIKNIASKREYIEDMALYLKQLNIPIFLRFANEMNVEPKLKDFPDEYINAFRLISEVMSEIAPNVAMLWSPNDISAAGCNYIMYYPGDEYVDWVGISSYHFKYFQGVKDWGNQQDNIDSVYFTGVYANPVKKIGVFIDFLRMNNINKPVMLSESGVGHISIPLGEDLTYWASTQLRRLYAYAPMVFPELKAMFYFNVSGRELGEVNDFALYTNDVIRGLYNELVNDEYFVTQVGVVAEYRYQEVKNIVKISPNMPIMTFTLPPKVLNPVVRYMIDGEVCNQLDIVPYIFDYDFGSLSDGSHILSVEVYDEHYRKLKHKDYHVFVTQGVAYLSDTEIHEENISVGIEEIKVEVNGEQISFEQPPILITATGRVVVPVRAIFEALDTEVIWDEENSIVRASKQGISIELSIGNQKAYVNDKAIHMDQAALLFNGRTMVPVRFISESLGADVRWEPNTRTIFINN